MNSYPWQAYNYGLEGQGVHPDRDASRYNLVYLAERIDCSCADFKAIGEFIIDWNIAVHGK